MLQFPSLPTTVDTLVHAVVVVLPVVLYLAAARIRRRRHDESGRRRESLSSPRDGPEDDWN